MDQGGPRRQNCDRGVQFEGSDMDRGGPRRQNCDRGVQFEGFGDGGAHPEKAPEKAGRRRPRRRVIY